MIRLRGRPAAAPSDQGEVREQLAGLELPRVYAELDTGPDGLSEEEVSRRRAQVGPNRLQEVRGPGLARRLLAQFFNLFAVLLWAGSALAFLTGLPTFGIAIVAVIVVNGVFGFFQEHRAERAVTALRRLLPQHAVVVRGGSEVQVPAEDLVPGDLLLVQEGDRVSADARLVEATELRVDESSLTGEAHPVQKSAQPERGRLRTVLEAHNLLFAGSTVVAGAARGVVISTGMGTEFGRIATLTQSVRQEPSPLQKEVGRVARQVALLSVAMGVVFFLVGYALAGLTLTDGAIFAIGIVLGNVPEGLLPTMTLSLAMGVQRMAKRNAIVKRLSSVETLGSCTVICTDKTGTLTANQMTVRELWAGGHRALLTGSGYRPEGRLTVGGLPATRAQLVAFLPLLRIGHLCNTARLLPPQDEHPEWRLVGDPTEGALLTAAAKAGLDRDFDLRLRPVVRRLGFDPKRKRMSTVHRALPQEDRLVAYVKGAPRELLDHCTRILVDGVELDLRPELRARALAENDRMARAGLRVLGMAYRHLPAADEPYLAHLGPGEVERDLVFAGLAGMQDPPREEVPEAVRNARQAGIRVIMITGDYGLTGESIARQIGLVGEGPVRVIDGAELEAMDDDRLRHALSEGEVIFARATPEHKLRVVTALRSLGEVVAVTGDGVNDAPALKRADIGVAMGRGGTDVAREAADMVLVDDNFATIVAAVEEGRAIFDNMRKFVIYIFAHLSPEAIPFIFFALFRVPLPLTVMQILAIDLGTETLPALALGVERPEPDVMRRPPRRRSERLLSVRSLLRGYVFLGFMTTAAVLGTFFLFLASRGWHWGQTTAPSPHDGAEATTIVFLGIVLMQVANAFACRTERVSVLRVGPFGNRFLLWGIVFEVAFAALLIYAPPLQPLFGTAPVQAHWWVVLAAFMPLVFLAEEVRKAVVRRHAGRT
ncbi:MAG TPA: cation-transporting P-type ATPase [Candidatus Dormibacteraeota bacterium]|nr:cation-transporting P-type ATPase [Candidatus Dormibacteraeota bacterium]